MQQYGSCNSLEAPGWTFLAGLHMLSPEVNRAHMGWRWLGNPGCRPVNLLRIASHVLQSSCKLSAYHQRFNLQLHLPVQSLQHPSIC